MPFDYLSMMARRAAPNPPRELKLVSKQAWRPVAKPLSEMRVTLMTSAAMREDQDPAFPPLGDATYRKISSNPAVTGLKIDHRSHIGYDARKDPEIVFPRSALIALANRGIVGGVTPSHLSFVGGIRLYRELEEELAPALAAELTQAGADLAILVPY